MKILKRIMKAFDGLMFWIGLLVQLNKYSNVVCADKKYRSRLPVPFGLYAAVSWPALPSSLCGRSPARIPVRGVLSTPVLRLRPFAALVPLRDYPSGSVPYKEPCRAAVIQGGCRGSGKDADRAGRTPPRTGERGQAGRRHRCFLSASDP